MAARADRSLSKYGNVVLSSRVRFARNVDGERFPDWDDAEHLCLLRERFAEACFKAGKNVRRKMEFYPIDTDPDGEAERLEEARLVSPLLADRGGGGLVMCTGTKVSELMPLSVMINEEDHFRIQALKQGYDIDGAFALANDFDNALSTHIKYAFSPKLGYLTSCPSNIGTGMRLSVELYLPGICMCEEFEALSNALGALRLVVRGNKGENSQVSNYVVQVSTGGTLGYSEGQVIDSFKRIIDEVIRQERLARRYIIRNKTDNLIDYFARALALASGARKIDYDESVAILHAVMLGLELGILEGLPAKNIFGIKAIMTDCELYNYLKSVGGLDDVVRRIEAKEAGAFRYRRPFDPVIEEGAFDFDSLGIDRAACLSMLLSHVEFGDFPKGLF